MSTSGRTLVAPPPSGDATGVTDYGLLQGLINTGGAVILGGGDYKVSQPLLPKGGTKLVGQGRYGIGDYTPVASNYTRLMPGTSFPTGAGDGVIMGSSSVTSGVEDVILQDLCVDVADTGTSIHALVLPDNSGAKDCRWVVDRCCFRQATGFNLYVGANWRAFHARDTIFDTNNVGYNVEIAGSDFRLVRCQIGNGKTSNIHVRNSIGTIRDCDIYGAANHGVVFDNATGGNFLTGGSVDHNGQHGVYIVNGVGSLSILGVVFHTNSETTNNAANHINNLNATAGLVNALGCLFNPVDSPVVNKATWCISDAVAGGTNDGGGATAGTGSNVFVAGSTVSGYKSQ